MTTYPPTPKTILAESHRAYDAEQALAARIAKLEAAPVPPSPAPSGIQIKPGDPLVPQPNTTYLLRGGTHRIAFGAVERHEAGVSILPYPGEAPVIDGTGLPQNWLYLGPGASWTLGAIALRNFHPVDSGIVGVGDGCKLTTLAGFSIVGMGRAGTPYESTSHAVYAHGTGTYELNQPDLTKLPGAALQHYRGTPQGVVIGGRLGAFYESALIYSGHVDFNGTVFVEPAAAWDLQIGGDATGTGSATLTGCTGTGPNGAVRRTG